MPKYYIIKKNLLRMCGPQIWLCLFTFPPITPKQLNSLTIIVTFSRLGDVEVTTAATGLGFKISATAKGFNVVVVFNLFTCRHATKVV